MPKLVGVIVFILMILMHFWWQNNLLKALEKLEKLTGEPSDDDCCWGGRRKWANKRCERPVVNPPAQNLEGNTGVAASSSPVFEYCIQSRVVETSSTASPNPHQMS